MKKIPMSIKFLSLIAVVLFSFSACNRGNKSVTTENLPAGTHAVSVIEVIQTSNYTYLQVFENNEKYWMAISKRESKAGDVLYYTEAMEMKDFKSKELNRTFPSILFIQDIRDTPAPAEKMAKSTGKISVKRLSEIKVEPAKDGITIADLFKSKTSFAKKTVKIRGVVVKTNKNIMGKNWAHIQDGTESGGIYDLTVTTNDIVQEGNIVTFEGTITLDKDFGSGYAYDVIMEDAKATDVTQSGDATL